MDLKQPIILFDGVCNLCNGFVQFVLDREKNNKITFAALQSEVGQTLLKQYNLPLETTPSSIIFISGNKAHTQSSAVLKMAKFLKKPWYFITYFLAIPKPIRDFIYRIIAKNRYVFFGKTEACWLPTPELQSRFLT